MTFPRVYIVLLALLVGLSSQAPVLAAPDTGKARGASLFVPTFMFRNGGTSSAGKAWCAKVNGGKVLAITALHVLGPDGGLPKQISGKRVASLVRRVDFRPAGGSGPFSSTRVVSKSGYVTNGPDFSGDLVFFEAPSELGSRAFEIASKPPGLKEPVWIYTKVNGDNRARAYPGIVLDSSVLMLKVLLHRPIPVQATSGSPVLDKRGKVVGLLCSAYPKKGVFFCNPSSSILKHIKADLRK